MRNRAWGNPQSFRVFWMWLNSREGPNKLASKFHPIKIMIFHWQRINETHQWCTRGWSFRLTSNIHAYPWVTVWWSGVSLQYLKKRCAYIRGDGSHLVTGIAKYCKEVQELRGIYPKDDEKLVKSELVNFKELKIFFFFANTVLQRLSRQFLNCVFWR